MANIKISALPAATAVNDVDDLVINQGGVTKKIARSLVKNAGTVTSVTGGTGLSGGTITGSGTLAVSYGSTAGTAAQGNDARLSDSRTPTGTAGGDLSGTYPNPTLNTVAVDKGGTGQTSYTDGQLLIGNTTGNTLAKAALTAGTGITVTNGPGTITVAQTNQTTTQVFTSSGTWTKPNGAKSIHVVVIAGGGGGGSGRASASGTAAGGGGGGGGSARTITTIDAVFLGATETVTVGAGGLGAIARSVGQDGLVGGNGGASSFGLWASCSAGGGGGAGTATAGGSAGPQGSRGLFSGAVGGLASATFAIGGNGNASSACPSGGAGGGVTAGTPGAASSGGTGGFQFLYNGGAQVSTPANTSGASVPVNLPYGGAGAGGGSASASAAANAGGNGGDYGAGGAGGGGSQGFASGAGGNGGNGIVVVTTYF